MAKNTKKGDKPVNQWKERWEKNKTSYIFIAGIMFVGIFSFWLTNQPFFEKFAQPILNTYASISNSILKILGQKTTAVGETIYSGTFSIQIKKGCDAIAPMILYVLAILFFPVPFKHKPKGILVGLLLIFILNIIRIVTLYLTGKYVRSLFDIMHTDVWQIIFIIFTLYIWLVWLKNVTAKSELQHA
ncbi:MAG TPA: archaeosortase/exosortase family protein [Saprospiraceae bacterium]|nr:archaeosortase/exosortase family protein [Saprospiraceae bacterium]